MAPGRPKKSVAIMISRTLTARFPMVRPPRTATIAALSNRTVISTSADVRNVIRERNRRSTGKTTPHEQSASVVAVSVSAEKACQARNTQTIGIAMARTFSATSSTRLLTRSRMSSTDSARSATDGDADSLMTRSYCRSSRPELSSTQPP